MFPITPQHPNTPSPQQKGSPVGEPFWGWREPNQPLTVLMMAAATL